MKANKVMEKADEKVLVRVKNPIISTWPRPAKLIMTLIMKIVYARAIEFTASREVCIVKKHYLDNWPTKTGFHYLSHSIFSYYIPLRITNKDWRTVSSVKTAKEAYMLQNKD